MLFTIATLILSLFATCETFVLAVCNMNANTLNSQRPKSNQEDFVLLACTAIRNLVSIVVSNNDCMKELTYMDHCSDHVEGLELYV